MSRPHCAARARLAASRRRPSALPSVAHPAPAFAPTRRTPTSFPASSPTPPSPLLPLFYPRPSTSRAFATWAAGRQVERELPPHLSSPAPNDGRHPNAWESPTRDRPEDAPSSPAEPEDVSFQASPPDPRQTAVLPLESHPAVRTADGQRILHLVAQGLASEAENLLRSHILARSDPAAEVASADEVKQLASAVLDVILHPSAGSASANSPPAANVEEPDPESATHHGSTLTRRAIRFLHFLRLHGQPRTEAMYGLLIRRILDQGHIDLAARVYVELVEEWAWEQKRAAARHRSAADSPMEYDDVEHDVRWLRRVEWVDPAHEDVWAFERWRRGPEAAAEDLPGQRFEQQRFELFKQRRAAARAQLAGADGRRTAAEVEIGQHKRELEEDAPFNGFFGGLRWNHRAEAQRRTLCWAPSPSRLRLYLRRFPPSVSKAPKALRPTTIPFPSMTLLNPILQTAGANLSPLSAYNAFAASASALAIVANTVHSRTLPLSHVSVLIKTFEALPQFPRVHAPLPSPDPVDDTTAFAHVQGALASLVYGLPPGSMDENVEKYGLNFISEGSANSLLSYTLTTLNSPAKGERVLSYMRCQGYLNSPASARATGQVLIQAALVTSVWRYFVDGLQMAVGEVAGGFLRLMHERPKTRAALRLAQGSQWQPGSKASETDRVPTLELPDHPLPERLGRPPPLSSPSLQSVGALSDEREPQLDASAPPALPYAAADGGPALAAAPSSDVVVSAASTQVTQPGVTPASQPWSTSALVDDDDESYDRPSDDKYGPGFAELFEQFLRGTTSHDPSAAAEAMLKYALAARRGDLVLEMYNYLLRGQDRPVPMTGGLYQTLIRGLLTSGFDRTAEQVFCLARKEQLTQGLELEAGTYVLMVGAYAKRRRRGLGHFTDDGTWTKTSSLGHLYPGDATTSDRVLERGWALYRGIMWGQWEHWGPLQDRILAHNSPFPRSKWFLHGPQVLPPARAAAADADEPAFVPPPSVDLPALFNAAIRLLRMREGMQTLPRRMLKNGDVVRSMIATVKKKALNQRQAEWPALDGLDFNLSLVAMDIKRAGYLVPLGVQLLLAKYPQHHERMEQVQSMRPVSTLARDQLGWATSDIDAFRLPLDQRIGGPIVDRRPTAAFDGREMERLGALSSYPASTFDESDVQPSDWPLLVWAALEGRSEADFDLPPGLWEAALEFKANFALSNDGQCLLLVGRVGSPVPFVPSHHREEFIELNFAAEARRLRPGADPSQWATHDPRVHEALARMAWWPGLQGDLTERLHRGWQLRRTSVDYQKDVQARVDDVVRSGARREDETSARQDEQEDGVDLAADRRQRRTPLPLPPAPKPLLPAAGLRPLSLSRQPGLPSPPPVAGSAPSPSPSPAPSPRAPSLQAPHTLAPPPILRAPPTLPPTPSSVRS